MKAIKVLVACVRPQLKKPPTKAKYLKPIGTKKPKLLPLLTIANPQMINMTKEMKGGNMDMDKMNAMDTMTPGEHKSHR